MDKSRTPQKNPQAGNRGTAAHSYARMTPDSISSTRLPPSELAALRDYQSLKIQVRQLQAKNRTLSSEVEQLLAEKSHNENKLIQKINFEEETHFQFQKEKNYQLELLEIKHEEDMSRLRRQAQLRADEYLREIKHKDYQIKQKDEQNRYLEMRNQELRVTYESLDREYLKSREESAALTDKLTSSDFHNKKLEMLVQDLEAQNGQMEVEIRTLLDIEVQKSRTLNAVQSQLRASEDNERRLTQKLNVLTDNFTELEDHIAMMKSKLVAADDDNRHLLHSLERAEAGNREKEFQISEQNQRENNLRIELEEHQKRETRRDREVSELITENQRLYHQLNTTRHRLHDFGVAYGVDV